MIGRVVVRLSRGIYDGGEPPLSVITVLRIAAIGVTGIHDPGGPAVGCVIGEDPGFGCAFCAGVGNDPGKVPHVLLTLESFGRLSGSLEAGEVNALYLIVLVELPLTSCLCRDDQIFIVVLGATKTGKHDE